MQTLEKNFIDITPLENKLKCSSIIEVFESLNCCESLTIRNDNDPRQVYYQLLDRKGDVFTWQYLQRGPEFWDVLITKVHEEQQDTIGEIAVKDLRKVAVFKKYGINVCCGGEKTVVEVCDEKSIDTKKLIADLQQVDAETKVNNIAYNGWSIDFLADFIVNTHHSYVRRYLPEILGYSIKVAQVHGKRHPDLSEIKEIVEEIYEELSNYMFEEERVLFPYIKEIVSAKKINQLIDIEADKLKKQIAELESGHEYVVKCFAQIRELGRGYTLPEDACESYNSLFKMLQEFEEVFHIHIHLENNILFPKAMVMEKSLAS